MELKAVCPQCSKEIEFSPEELEGLEELIKDEREEALDEAEPPDTDEVLASLASGRVWQDLSAAIRHGNRDEAEYWLDRIAGEAGHVVQNEVSLGRFGSRKAA